MTAEERKKNRTQQNMFLFSQVVSLRMIAKEETHKDPINRNKKIGTSKKKRNNSIDGNEEEEIHILYHIKQNIRFE